MCECSRSLFINKSKVSSGCLQCLFQQLIAPLHYLKINLHKKICNMHDPLIHESLLFFNSIQKQHAVIFNKKGVIEIESVSGSGSKTKINGIPLTGRKALCHKDRILFGTKSHYVQLLLICLCMNAFSFFL